MCCDFDRLLRKVLFSLLLRIHWLMKYAPAASTMRVANTLMTMRKNLRIGLVIDVRRARLVSALQSNEKARSEPMFRK